MNTKVHAPDDSCVSVHCYWHHVDEPDGEVMCGECFHSWPTRNDFLADHALTRAELGLWAPTDPDVNFCPFCIHDL